MAQDKKNEAAEAEVKEKIEEVEELADEAAEVEDTAEAAEPAEDAAEEAAEEPAAEEAPEEAAEEPAAEEAPEEPAEEPATEEAPEEAAEEPAAEEAPVRMSSKRIKKAERREAKAARKAANKIEEKKSRPNNALIAILIFGVVVAMFAFVLGYNYFSKPATIAKYIEDNGGEEAFGSMQLDAFTTANITADGNSMKIELKATADDELAVEQLKEYYGGDEGKHNLEHLAAYFLANIKPQTRAFSADVTANMTLNDEELNSVKLSYKEAKDLMEEEEEEAAEDAEDASEDAAEETADDAEEASDDAAEAAEDAADAAEDAAEDAADEAEGEGE